MTTHERFEQELPELLAQLATASRPDYRDSLVRATARTRQRPAWTFPERWLPMDIVARRYTPSPIPRLPVLMLAAAALIAAAAVGLLIASQPKIPKPFGPAANGLIAYGSNGDLFVLDSGTGNSKLLLGGTTTDTDPDFSLQGDRLSFYRHESDLTAMYVMNADGTSVRQVVPPTKGLDASSWSPDGRLIAFRSQPADASILSLVDTRTGEIRDVDVDPTASWPILWRPAHQDQLLVRVTADNGSFGLLLVDTTLGTRTPLAIAPEKGGSRQFDFQRANWSPDGARLVVEVGRGINIGETTPTIYLKIADIAKDGAVTGTRRFIHDVDADYEYDGAFTPDGSHLLLASQRGCLFQVYLAPLDDPTAAVGVGEVAPEPASCATSGIGGLVSPDGTRVLSTKGDGTGEDRLFLGDAEGGPTRALDVTSGGWISWQRIAP